MLLIHCLEYRMYCTYRTFSCTTFQAWLITYVICMCSPVFLDVHLPSCRAKATINRFRTKPGDFKVKLHEMFVAYFKSLLVKNSTESRASISRRYRTSCRIYCFIC